MQRRVKYTLSNESMYTIYPHDGAVSHEIFTVPLCESTRAWYITPDGARVKNAEQIVN